MPLRGPDNKEYDGSQDEWTDEEKEGTGELLKKIRKLRSPIEPEPEPENFQPAPSPPPSDEPTAEEIVEHVAELVNKEDILITGDTDEETGLLPVILRKAAAVSPSIPAQRGRHVGGRALAVLSRMPLVGLKYLRDSAEFVVYDDQPPPSGEYVVQALGVTTLEYDGVQQNHLLVSFKAGQVAGFGMEDTYTAQDITILGAVADYPVDIKTLLGARNGRSIVVNHNRNITLKVNSKTANPIQLFSVQSPYIIDMGLNLHEVYITTTKDTKVKLEAW